MISRDGRRECSDPASEIFRVVVYNVRLRTRTEDNNSNKKTTTKKSLHRSIIHIADKEDLDVV
jgi:hypothetical protein